MFFILICFNLVAYIASAFFFYEGNMTKAIIGITIAVMLSIGILIMYNEKKVEREKGSSKKSRMDKFDCLECVDCGDCGDVGGFDCNCS